MSDTISRMTKEEWDLMAKRFAAALPKLPTLWEIIEHDVSPSKVYTYIPINDKERQHKQLKRAFLQAKLNLLHFEVENEISEDWIKGH